MEKEDWLFEKEQEMKAEFDEPDDEMDDEMDDDFIDDLDRCGCSDPTCPCSGWKRGSHHNI